MSALVGIGAYSQPMSGKLLGTGDCTPCAAAAAANGFGTVAQSEREAELNAQYEAWTKRALVISGAGFVGFMGLMWWLGKDD